MEGMEHKAAAHVMLCYLCLQHGVALWLLGWWPPKDQLHGQGGTWQCPDGPGV